MAGKLGITPELETTPDFLPELPPYLILTFTDSNHVCTVRPRHGLAEQQPEWPCFRLSAHSRHRAAIRQRESGEDSRYRKMPYKLWHMEF